MKNEIIRSQLIYEGWSTLHRYTIDVSKDSQLSVPVHREIYDSGNGAAVLLYNSSKRRVILTRQFRLAAKLNGHDSGYIIEACAGLLDDMDPVEAIKKEILEETGLAVRKVKKIMESYASPGAHKEKIWLFTAEYSDSDKIEKGGGLSEEHEEIEVLEFTYKEIFDLYNAGKFEDSKTIILIQYAILKGLISGSEQIL